MKNFDFTWKLVLMREISPLPRSVYNVLDTMIMLKNTKMVQASNNRVLMENRKMKNE